MTDAARALLESLIDDAGLFPPAELTMRAALAGHAAHRSGEDAWMLGRFVVPLVRLDEFERAFDGLPAGARARPWRLAALGSGSPSADARTIAAFNARHGDAGRRDATIESIDVTVGGPDDTARAAEALPGPVERYFELAIDTDPTGTLAAIAAVGGRAKIRTGGVTADRFPSARLLARFVVASAAAGVAFKATAGLHHPVRSAHPAGAGGRGPIVVMHGFLNLFLAAALARAHGAREDVLVPVLDEESAGAFAFDGEWVRVAGRSLARDEIASARRSFALSFGSCSFDDPISELKALGVI